MKKKTKKNKNLFKEKKTSKFMFSEETEKWLGGVLMFLIAIIIIFSFFNLAGVAGKILQKTLSFLIGKAVFSLPLIFILGGLMFFSPQSKKFLRAFLLAAFLLVLGISGTLEGLNPGFKQGGYLGYLSGPLLGLFGFWVTQIIFGAMILLGILIFWQLFRQSLFKEIPLTEAEKIAQKPSLIKKFFLPKFRVKEIPSKFDQEVKISKESPPELKVKTLPALPLRMVEGYEPPPFDLLEPDQGVPTSGDIRLNSAIIKKTLQNFGIPVEMSEVNIGPTVTQYTLKPAEGIKVSQITSLANDLALALASHPIRIEAPIPGRSVVGIEVPNKVRAQVKLRNLIENPNFQRSLSNLTIVMGRDVSGNPLYADLAKMPHLLVAGSTGTGKTIFLNSLIISLLYRNSPEILRFILIDPKRVEFPIYNDLPHLLAPVIYDPQKTITALQWLISEMERRFDIFSAAKTRDINSYNEMAQKLKPPQAPLPYLILIIDELADLMAARGREIEAGIVRLAQMSRAVGIHLVVATQRPSVEVITGLIKANITSRVTFQVASQVDSRTVLDMAGAEKLLGAGDFLYLSAEIVKPRRIQGAYVSEKEIKKVVNYIKSKFKGEESKIGGVLENQLAENLEKTLALPEAKLAGFSEEDPLYEEAKRIVILAQRASASLLQRKLRIGYARAARLIDMLEERGVVGPGEGAKAREVYIKIEGDEESKKSQFW